MMQQQKQSEHGGTGEQETEIGTTTNNQRDTFAETHPEDPDTLNTGSIEDEPAADGDATVRNPSGDNIGRAAEGDEGSDSRF
jgi:hypothetical protein